MGGGGAVAQWVARQVGPAAPASVGPCGGYEPMWVRWRRMWVGSLMKGVQYKATRSSWLGPFWRSSTFSLHIYIAWSRDCE